jgi:hypothetical protein
MACSFNVNYICIQPKNARARKKGGVMKVSIEVEHLKNILRGARKQFINAAICNSAGKWSEQYFVIDDLREIKTEHGTVAILLLHSPSNSECAAIDIRHISRLRFNKCLSIEGASVKELAINAKKIAEDNYFRQRSRII